MSETNDDAPADPSPPGEERGYWTEVEDVFDAALAVEGPARTAVLDARCAGRTALRAEVESLLVAHARAGRFIAPVNR